MVWASDHAWRGSSFSPLTQLTNLFFTGGFCGLGGGRLAWALAHLEGVGLVRELDSSWEVCLAVNTWDWLVGWGDSRTGGASVLVEARVEGFWDLAPCCSEEGCCWLSVVVEETLELAPA